MKRIFLIICAAMIMLALSGCDLVPTDITTLMKPPKLAGEQQNIQQGLENAVGSDYTLKYALSGSYRSAFILQDIDGDGVEEAIALYSLNTQSAGTHIMILRQNNGKWTKAADISGDGNEVERIDFGNYDGSGVKYLTVGWTVFTSSSYSVEVYKLDDGADNGYKKLYTGSFTDLMITDLDKDGSDDMLLLKLDSNTNNSEAALVSCKNGKFKEIGNSPLDSTVTGYEDLFSVSFSDGTMGVYADGYKSATSMVTELLWWKDGRLSSPFYDKTSGVVTSTLRNVTLNCMDINGDSVIDIPFAVEMPGYLNANYSEKIWKISWCDYDGKGSFIPVLNCIWNFDEGYYFIMPNSWKDNVTVQLSDDGGSWVFREWNTKKMNFKGRILFEITAYTKSAWNSMESKSGFTKALEQGGKVYAIKMGTSKGSHDKLYLSLNDVISNLKSYY